MRPKIAVLDDYQGVALKMADWSAVMARAEVDVFSDHLAGMDAVAARLLPYDIVCVMRERTPLRAELLGRLPNLKFIASTGPRNASIDLTAAAARGIEVAHTGYFGSPTVELTWALILASARHIVSEAAAVRSGRWQHSMGDDLSGKTLGVIGLGNVGSKVAGIGLAFGMRVIAWSQNLTAEKARALGVSPVSKEELLRQSDIVSLHLVLSERSRGLIGAEELSLMKRSARLVNTSRGPIVAEAALIAALQAGQIAGAAIDVYDTEPLPAAHPYRNMANLLATPHIGYVSRGLYERFYRDTVSNIIAWLDAGHGRET
jgi:phosphoglycerate dehydrogenase-like enzyme